MTYRKALKRYSELEKKVSGVFRYQENMSLHTSFRVGGPADVFVIPSSTDEVQEIVDYTQRHGIPLQVMGMGSNLLVSDEGLAGMVLKIASPLDEFEPFDHQITVGAGIKCTKLIAYCLRHQLTGLDFLSGIPGTLGGAIAMNAGSFGCSIGQRLYSALLFDQKSFQWQVFYQDDFHFAYRVSLLQQSDRYILLQATLDVFAGSQNQEISSIREKLLRRKLSQPLQYPNAGCIWKNPPGTSAGKLIEDAGLKGFAKGHARISELHANFIIHDGKAKAMEIYDLINAIEEKIFHVSGIQLEREIKIIGNFGFKF